MERHRMLVETARERFLSNTDRSSSVGCWLWTGHLNQYGYGRFRVVGRMVLAPVFAWEQAVGAYPPSGMRVCHTCDEPACVRNDDHGVYVVDGRSYERWGHLWLGSQAANMRDASEKGRIYGWPTLIGERVSSARLTPEKVLAIRARYPRGESYQVLATAFGVAKSTVEAVVKRQTWAHV